MTAYYINNGYINSGVILPDQDIEYGVITFQVIEGKLSDIKLTGNKWLRNGYITKRIDPGKEKVLNINTLQEKLQLLQVNPLIKYVKGEIEPGINMGEAVLKVQVEEAKPYHAGIKASNQRSPNSGAEVLEVYASQDNLTTFGDKLEFHYGITKGVDDVNGFYSFPLNASDTKLSLHYSKVNSTVVDEPFDKLDIESFSETFGVTLSHPIFKSISQEFSLALTGERRHNKTTLLGIPFSFSEGIQNGECDVSVVRLEQNYVVRSRVNVFALRSVFNIGLNVMGATMNSSGPDSKFFTWVGQFQMGHRMENLHDSQIIFRADTQLAGCQLLPMERFAIGGMSTVRGYRENTLLRDSGIISSLEMRVPLFRLPLPKITKGSEEGILEIAPFADIGYGWNEKEIAMASDIDTLSSVGLGLRWNPSQLIHSEIYWGYALRSIENNGKKDIQDHGVHFLMNWQFF